MKHLSLWIVVGLSCAGCGLEMGPSVQLEIDGPLSDDARHELVEKLKGMTDGSSHSIQWSASGDHLSITLGPVSDAQALADKIDFGTVVKVDGRTIQIRIGEESAPDEVENRKPETDGGPDADAAENIPAPAIELDE